MVKKNYENLVEAVTNHAIKTTADASPNNILSLSSSSPIFNLGPYNRGDAYRIDEPEVYYYNNKGDIAE